MSNSIRESIGNISKNPKFRVMFSAITVNIFTIALGCTLSYANPAVPNLNDNRNPFRVNIYEQSWIGGVLHLGNALGSLVCGSLSDFLGRKLAMMFSAVFCVIGYTLVSSATNVQTLYAGVFINGTFASINGAAVLLYCSEIATSDNRGVILSMYSMGVTVGMVIEFVAGSYLPWNWLAIFTTILYVFPPLILAFLPESPRWFLLKGNREAAAHGLKWFQGEHANIEKEMNIIEQSLVDAPKGMFAWRDLLKRENAKPLLVVCVLILVQAFSGNFVMVVFSVTIFHDAKVDINPNLQAVITVIFSFLGSAICLFVVERCGRRQLLFVSTVFTALGMGILAAFFQIQEMDFEFATSHLSWLPMLGLSMSNFMFYAGLLPIPWILACELFSTNVRGIVVTVANVFAALLSFAATKSFANIESDLDTAGAFAFYAAWGVFGIGFILFVVEEPKKRILA